MENIESITIPIRLYNVKSITQTEVALLAVIKAFSDANNGYCAATNEMLAKSLNLSIPHIQRYLLHLEQTNFIVREVILDKNTCKSHRKITIVEEVNDLWNIKNEQANNTYKKTNQVQKAALSDEIV